MGEWINAVGATLRDASLTAAGLFGLVALAMLACRQPVRRIWLARTALVGSLALIPLVAFAPLPRVELAAVLRSEAFVSHPIFDGWTMPTARAASATPGAIAAPGFSQWVVWVGRPPQGLVIGYLTGLGLTVGWLLLGYLGLAWVLQRATAPSSESLALFAALDAPHLRPRLRVSTRVERPVLVGLVRPTILIPAELDLPESADELRLGLLHELAHARSKDTWFALASNLAQAFWFFLPPVWWVRAQLRMDQEFMADRNAARRYGPLRSYASSLLTIAHPTGASTAGPRHERVRGDDGASPLFLRMLMLVRCPFEVETRPPRWWAWLLPTLLLAGTLSASCLTARLPDDPPPSSWHTATARSHSFKMARLLVPPPAPSTPQPTTIFELPMSLPEQFELSVDVWGDARTVAATHVVGRSLEHPKAATDTSTDERWHCVRIRRDGYGVSIWIDQVRLPRSRDMTTSSTLQFEPPAGRPGHFRNLHLAW